MSERHDLELDAAPEETGVVINLETTVDPLLSQWARWRDQFREGMADGFWTVEDLEQKIAHRRAFFFPGRNAAMVGEIVEFPGGMKVLQMLWCVGDIAEIVGMAPGVEALGRMMGCGGMLVEGRPAWSRILRANGYEPWSATVFKAL